MEQRFVGQSGLVVSSLGLGTRTWGLDTDLHEASDMLATYLDAGGTTIEVEDDPRFLEPLETVGALISGHRRSDLQIILRSGGRPEGTDVSRPPSRGALLSSLESALSRLGTDWVDLWIVEGPRGQVPLSELTGSAHLAWESGKARYAGLGSLNYWDAGAATQAATDGGWGFAAWGGRLSILEPLLAGSGGDGPRQAGLGIVAGAPLAGGLLTGKYQHSTPPDARATSPRFKPEFTRFDDVVTHSVVEATRRAAEGMDRSAAQVALAWAKDSVGVATTIVGPRSTRQLLHLLELGDWTLPSALRNVLTEVAVSRFLNG